MPKSLLEIAKDLTLTLVETGSLSADHMQDALQKTYAILAGLQAQEETRAASLKTQQPADWRKSITRHGITCLECGIPLKQLSGLHLRGHGMDARSYRDKYGIPPSQSLASRKSAAKRRQIASEVKPWENSPNYIKGQEDRAATAKKAGRKRVGGAKRKVQG